MTDLITKEWQTCWDTMRDVGDEEANKLLSSLVMKDRFDQSRVVLDGTNTDGWTLFHKASLHNCIECGIRIIESVARVSKDQEYGGPNQVLEYLNKTTSNGSTPLMISNRWKESEFSKMLNKQKLTYELLAKKEQKEQKEKQDAYDEEMRQYENNNGNYSDDEDDEYDEYDHNHGEKDKNKENGKLNFAPIQAEFDVNAPYGERTEQWWNLWHGFHNNKAEVQNDLKEFMRANKGFEELGCVSSLPNTAGMTLLHQAALNGMTKCVGSMVRSGAFGGSTSDPCRWCFDLKGRTPREVALRYGRKDCLDLLDEYSHKVNLKIRKKQERRLLRSMSSASSMASMSTPGNGYENENGSMIGGMSSVGSEFNHLSNGTLLSDDWWKTWHSLHSNNREEGIDAINLLIQQYEIEYNINQINQNENDSDNDSSNSNNSKKNKKKSKSKFSPKKKNNNSPKKNDENENNKVLSNINGEFYDQNGFSLPIPELVKSSDVGYSTGKTLLEQASANGNAIAVQLLLMTHLFHKPSLEDSSTIGNDGGHGGSNGTGQSGGQYGSPLSRGSPDRSISFSKGATSSPPKQPTILESSSNHSYNFDDDEDNQSGHGSGIGGGEEELYETEQEKLLRLFPVARALKIAQTFKYVSVCEVIYNYIESSNDD